MSSIKIYKSVNQLFGDNKIDNCSMTVLFKVNKLQLILILPKKMEMTFKHQSRASANQISIMMKVFPLVLRNYIKNRILQAQKQSMI